MTTTDPIDIIDGALRLFDGGRNWGQGSVWYFGRGCVLGGLAHVANPDAISNRSKNWDAWREIPPPLRGALIKTLPEVCDYCRRGVEYEGPGRVAHHNDAHVTGYPEIAALLGAVKGALVGEAEREGVLV